MLVFIITAFSSILVHEFGHYIGGQAFGFNPKLEWSKKGLFVSHIPTDSLNWKEYTISAMGIVGIIPLLFYLLVFKDLSIIPIIIFMSGYSIFEIVLRHKKIKESEKMLRLAYTSF